MWNTSSRRAFFYFNSGEELKLLHEYCQCLEFRGLNVEQWVVADCLSKSGSKFSKFSWIIFPSSQKNEFRTSCTGQSTGNALWPFHLGLGSGCRRKSSPVREPRLVLCPVYSARGALGCWGSFCWVWVCCSHLQASGLGPSRFRFSSKQSQSIWTIFSFPPKD